MASKYRIYRIMLTSTIAQYDVLNAHKNTHALRLRQMRARGGFICIGELMNITSVSNLLKKHLFTL
jgi:uncharacterized protein YciI